MGGAHGDQRRGAGVAYAIQVAPEAHPGVDGHGDGAEFQQAEHADDQVVAGTDRQEHAGPLGDPLGMEDPRGRIAGLVELPEAAAGVDDPSGGTDRQRRKRRG